MCPRKKLYAILLLCLVAPGLRATLNDTSDGQDSVSNYFKLLSSIKNLTDNWKSETGHFPWNIKTARNETGQVSRVGQLSGVPPEYPHALNTTSASSERKSTRESSNQQHLKEELSEDSSFPDLLKHEIHRHKVDPDNHTLKLEIPLLSRSRNVVNFSRDEDPRSTSLDANERAFTDEVMNRNESTQLSPEYSLVLNTTSTSNEQNSTLKSFNLQHVKEKRPKESSYKSLSDFLRVNAMNEKHRHRLAPANHTLKNDVPLISRSRNVVNFSREYEDASSISLDPYERAFTDKVVNSPSPCQNGGTFTVVNGNYLCLCGLGYNGVTCEIHTAVCQQPLKPGESLPCVNHDKTCRPMPGGGFVCESDLVSARNTTYHNTSNLVECVGVGGSLCPDTWQCFNVNQTTDNFRCAPPSDELLYPDFQGVDPITRKRRSTSDDVCKDNLCQHGSVCKKNKCICLLHYSGRYCEKEINYCASNPCKEGVPCEPRLGGYNCDCPATHTGIQCEIPKRIALKQMKRPNFLFVIQQYSGMSFHYCFYANPVGELPSVVISFEDGASKKVHESDFTRLSDVKNRPLKTVFPDLNLLNTDQQLVVFKHAYKKPGYYNITVRAHNAMHLVYTSTHTVRVDPPWRCELSTKLRNCVRSIGANITEYTREDQIVILSDTIVNCSHAKLSYEWSLHKLKTILDKHTEENLFLLGPDVATNEPHLNIYPYILPFGVYAAQLNVTMKKPRSHLFEYALTWFKVKEMKIVARLVEGSLQQMRWSSPVILDASESYNPNMPPKQQKNLVFAWTCAATGPLQEGVDETVDTFCPDSTDTHLLTGGPILHVPPKSLVLNWGYVFALQVSEAGESSEYRNETEAMVAVVVEVMPDDTPIMMVRCVRNCENNQVNPFDTVVLEAVCTTCSKSLSEEVGTLEWRFTSLESKENSRTMSSDESVVIRNDLGSNMSTLVLDEGIMSGHERFFVALRVIGNALLNTTQRNEDTNSKTHIGAERVINIASPPLAGYCNIVPQQGYATLTSFHIFCYNFKDESPPLRYEATQFTNISDSDANFVGTLVGYEMESEIHDLRLAAGLPDNDHLTLIRTIVSSKYLYTYYDCNVTVFPMLYYLKSPIQVLNFLTQMVKDETSSLGLLKGTSNFFASTQMIKVTAESATDILNSDYVRYINVVELEQIIQSIQDGLANYLNQQAILNVGGLKHYATALGAIMNLPRYHRSSVSNVIEGKLLENIVDMLENLKTKSVILSKADVEDLAPRVMSAAANLLKRPIDPSNSQFKSTSFQREGEERDQAPRVEISPVNRAELANFTLGVINNILAYGRHIMSYKASHEKSTLCQSQGPDLRFSVQKNSPSSFSKNGLFIRGCVGLVPIFSGELNALHNELSVYLLYLQENPFWWHPKANGINYPLVQLRMYDAKENTVKVPTKVMMQNPKRMQYKTIHGHLAIHPYWTLNDYDIQVNRVQVPKGGKLIVQFMPIPGNHKIQVIVKKGFRPELIDFWKEAHEVPRTEGEKGTILTESYSVYVDEESTSDHDFYYVGVLPHIETLHALSTENGQKSLFPQVFTNDDEVYDEDDDEIKNDKQIGARFFEPRLMKVREPTNNTLPFEYAAYSVRCLALNTSAEDLRTINDCHVRPASTFETVFCQCDDFEMLTASLQSVDADLHMARTVQFHFPVLENPLTFYLIFFVLILFFIILLWALRSDNDDKLHREIIFLEDNDPRHSYLYLVIVQTGLGPRSGTSSNVAIQLIGQAGNSEVHILKSAHRPVLGRGSQEWFVLKTSAPLGHVPWINLWHDHLEASPRWFCSKVTVHDIQTNEVWFFFADQWLAPLHGDGKMSCSVYTAEHSQVFEQFYRFDESCMKVLGDGYHGWVSPFYKNAGNSYTRCQRVIVAFVHTLIMMLIIIHVFDWPSQDDDLSKNEQAWTKRNLNNGIYTALIAFPLHLCLQIVFMCVTPKPSWGYTPVYWRQYMKLDMPDEYKPKDENDPSKAEHARGDRFYTVAYRKNVMIRTSTPPENQTNIPMIGRNVGQEWFCLPHWFKYILWITLLVFIIISLFFIYFNGVEHSTVTGYSTLVTLIIAILFSIYVLESAKVITLAIYRSIMSRNEITVENRSDLAFYLEDEYGVDPLLVPKRLLELELLREYDMYRPIPEQRVLVLQRNAMKEYSVRSMFTDISIFLLFLFLLLIALNGVTDSLGYLNVDSVKNVIQGRSGFGKVRLDMITEQEGFLDYIRGSLIPNLHEEENYNRRQVKGKGLTADLTNHLIGVPRLRQIRVPKDDCKEILKPDRDWASRCKINYLWVDEDTADYTPGWQEVDKNKPGYHRVRSPDHDTAAWMYETWWASATAASVGVVSAYSGGGYVALLGRSRQASWQALEHLRSNNWFDALTVAVFLEFTLYNPNRNLVSAVTILAENTAMGGYEVRSRVDLVKFKPADDMTPFIIFALFTLLVIVRIVCAHHDGFRIKKLRRWTYFGNIWYALNIVLAIMGLIVAFCLLARTFLVDAAMEKLEQTNVNKYVQFNVLLHWDQILLVIMALMLFFVILQMWHLLSVEFRCHFVMTVLQVSTHSLMCFAFIFFIFLCAFTSAGYLLFVATTYQFRTFLDSFVAMVGFTHRDSYQEIAGGKLFFFTFAVMFFFIFRWGFVLILIDKFRRVSRVVLRRKWLEPVIVSFMQMNLASVRDFGRRGFVRSQADSLIDEYVRASFRKSLARLRAMELIVAYMNEQQKAGPLYGSEFIAKCKELVMVATVVDYIEGQMQHKSRGQNNQMVEEKYGSTIEREFAKERKATAMLVTHLKMSALEQKLDNLDETVDWIIQTKKLMYTR